MPHRTILVADPDPDSRTIYAALLGSEGYTVHTFADAEETCRLALTLRPALVITELHVGDRDAWSLAHALGAGTGRPTPILLITAGMNPHVQERAYRTGFAGWLTKPYEPDRLLAIIRQLVGPGEHVIAR